MNRSRLRWLLEDNILSFWMTRMTDRENGGYYGQMRGDGTLVCDAPKGGILNARILWAFSAAYRLTGNAEYLNAAARAKDYILAHFIDREYGGTYWSVDYEGRMLDGRKQFYAIGFMLYGLSEYYRVTADEEVMVVCRSLFEVIETHACDSEYGGYIEACTREWGRTADMRLSELDANCPKSQNTHLHILESYTNLYRVWKDERLEKALRGLIDVFSDRILNPKTHHLGLFFNMDWSRDGDGVSYGHDIECSWLLHEAALVLGDRDVLGRVEPIVRDIAHASEEGINPDGSMLHESNPKTGCIDHDRHWWVQAETVVGFYNIWQHFGDGQSLRRAESCLKYIMSNLVDYENGEWYWSVDADGNASRRVDKAGFWKCPYHNSRMCMELMERKLGN